MNFFRNISAIILTLFSQRKNIFIQNYVHTTNLNTVRTPYRAGTLISKHFALSLDTVQLSREKKKSFHAVWKLFKLKICLSNKVWTLRPSFSTLFCLKFENFFQTFQKTFSKVNFTPFRNFKCVFWIKKRFNLLFKMETICVNKLTRNSANQRPSSVWTYLTKQFTNSSQKWTINMCK
jgi:hypothetical protein